MLFVFGFVGRSTIAVSLMEAVVVMPKRLHPRHYVVRGDVKVFGKRFDCFGIVLWIDPAAELFQK